MHLFQDRLRRTYWCFVKQIERQSRRESGSMLSEMPAAMYIVFVGLLIPLIGLITLSYRYTMLYFAARDACYQAAKSATFTLAQTNAATRWGTDIAAWTGTTGTETLYIVIQPIGGGAETTSTTKLPASPAPNAQNFVYFIRLVGTCDIQPLFKGASWEGLSIPGLTAVVPVTLKYQTYCENPSGLTQ